MPIILPPRDILETQPELLYKIGFAETKKAGADKIEAEYHALLQDDILQRAALGKRLSNICENLTDPLIIALNSGWDTGKTWFLKHWVGAHKIENSGKALTIYLMRFRKLSPI